MSAAALYHELLGDLQAGRPERAFDRLVDVRGAQRDLREVWTARTMLKAVVEQMPASAFDRSRRAAAQARALQVPPPRQRPGRVVLPAVAAGHARFVEVEVQVAADAPGSSAADPLSPEGLSDAVRGAVAAALAAARGYLQRPALRFRVRLSVEVDGPSCGLAVALAAISAAGDLPVGDDLAATGAVSADGRVGAVGHMADKLRLRREARPGARLLCPAGQEDTDPQVTPVADLAQAARYIHAGPGRDIEHLLGDLRREFTCGRWPEAARVAHELWTTAADELRADERVEVLSVLLAAANHRGDQAVAAALLERLRPDLAQPQVTLARHAQVLAHAAVQAVDLLRPEQAEAVLSLADGLPLPAADAGWLHVRGVSAMVAIMRGDFAQARELRQTNLQHAPREERPRCWIDLADVLWRCDELAAAQEACAAALGELDELLLRTGAPGQVRRRDYLEQTRRHGHLCAARLARLAGAREAALEHLQLAEADAALQPRVALERALLLPARPGESALSTVDERRSAALRAVDGAYAAVGQADLDRQPIYRALRLRARVWAGDAAAADELSRHVWPGSPDPQADLSIEERRSASLRAIDERRSASLRAIDERRSASLRAIDELCRRLPY